jgi:hypothetical protein
METRTTGGAAIAEGVDGVDGPTVAQAASRRQDNRAAAARGHGVMRRILKSRDGGRCVTFVRGPGAPAGG